MASSTNRSGDSLVKKFVALLLVALIGIPSAAVPVAKGADCAMPEVTAAPACTYCAPATPAATPGPTLEASCCRFLPTPERIPAQAGSLGATPKPIQSPDLAAVFPAIDGLPMPAASGDRARTAQGASPPQTLPTRTTHLLL